MIARSLALLALATLVGCTKPSSNPPVPGGGGIAKPSPVGSAAHILIVTPDGAAFAKEFLKSVHEGKATAAQLSPQFKKVIAEPVLPDEEALGYSDRYTGNWLKSFEGQLANATLSAPAGEGEAIVFTGSVPAEKPMQLTLRIVKSGGAWLVDWFFPAEVGPVTVPTLNHQSFAAAAFLEGLFGKKDAMAAGMISPSAKKYLAPPLGTEKAVYNKGRLGQKLAEYRGGFTGFSIAKVENDTVTGEAFKGEAKKPFALKLVKGERPFEWQVEEVKID